MANFHTLPQYGVNSTPNWVTGRYLAHNHLDLIGRAFLAVDLHTSVKLPTDLTMTQSSWLARVNRTYAWWAEKRQAERAAIEAGLIPLVPARRAVPKTNGHTVQVPIGSEITNSELVNIAHVVGAEGMLEAALAVEGTHAQ